MTRLSQHEIRIIAGGEEMGTFTFWAPDMATAIRYGEDFARLRYRGKRIRCSCITGYTETFADGTSLTTDFSEVL